MKPTAIQVAEDLTFEFQSASSAYEENPEQAVFTLKSVIKILKDYGIAEPDFQGRALLVTNGNPDANNSRLRKVARAITKAREEKGLTIAQLAHLVHRKPSQVAAWESGKANLELNTILLIEKHLPVKILGI